MFDLNPTPEQTATLVKAGSIDPVVSARSGLDVAKAIETPLRKGVLPGDILEGVFRPVPLAQGATPDFPLHFLAPGTEKDFVAYTIPNHGYIPQRHVEGDSVMIPVYPIGGSIDTNLRYLRDARWDVVGAMMENLRAQFTKKINDDGFHTLLAAAVDRNVIIYDSDAGSGQFTKRVLSLAKLLMRRNAGGNSTSLNRHRLTDLFLSPEAMEDIRNWGVDQIDEVTRREIYLADDDGSELSRIFNVNLHVIDELGDGQEYQRYLEEELGVALPAGDVEFGLGLDLTRNDSLIMVVREQLQIFNDSVLHRHQRVGWYGWMELGFGVLDTRLAILLSW
jgi:hypothetical protein